METFEAKAKLTNANHPPRKMRLLADLIRGQSVDYALNILKYHPKKLYARKLEKLLMSCVANWKEKYGEEALEDANLYVSTVTVDEGRMLKRVRPRAQGRAFLIRRRSCHINLFVQNNNEIEHLVNQEASEVDEAPEVEDTSEGEGENQQEETKKGND